jgi:DNA-binding NtrC family response regulator
MPSITHNLSADAASSHILVVDDDVHVRTTVARLLARKGYSCAQAGSADTAWKHLQENEVHLVMLDVARPGPSGSGLLRRISESFPMCQSFCSRPPTERKSPSTHSRTVRAES